MTDVERSDPIGPLQALLDEQGMAVPAGTTVLSKEFSIELGVTKIFGVELSPSAAAVGRLIVRQVEQLPDPYTAALPEGHPDLEMFRQNRMAGVLADVCVRSVSASHLFVARKSLLRIRDADNARNLEMSASRQRAFGKAVNPGNMLAFDTSDVRSGRLLELPEMDYNEPGIPAMIFAALRRR